MEKLLDLSPKKIGEISGSPKANRMSQYEKEKKRINLMDIQKNRDIKPRNRKMSKRMLKEHFKDRSIEVSQRILQRRLTEFDLMTSKPYCTPKLTLVMIEKRLEWPRKHKKTFQ
ncbi:hypothetical protein CEXT_328071 [Caerostris extrusa]|uniref:Transposase Tc1-like domain-containing protein n=1 Tax=Caerostris extrusa TaxID=172846 RepID=A0AAV4VU53_CAEEX|nr:hypothetical protein CEXT_328071 [Caerostris extrusa]